MRTVRRRLAGPTAVVVAGMLALAAVALLVGRPARVLGVSEDVLAESLAAQVDDPPAFGCTEAARGWRCRVQRSEGREGGIVYAIDVNDWGCWRGRAIGPAGRFPAPSGCIWAIDYVRLLND